MNSDKHTSKRLKIVFCVLLGLICCAGLIYFLSKPKEPSYQGKKLSAWLYEHDEDKAREAFEHMGTNTIPFLLNLFFAKDDIHYRAIDGFRFLGSRAEPAIPVFSNEIFYGEQKMESFLAIANVGSNSLPILLKGLKSEDKEIRYCAAQGISYVGSPAESAISALIEHLKDEDSSVRCATANALGKIKMYPDIVIPALIEALDDPQITVKLNAANALSEFGSLSSNAVPKLTKIAESNIGGYRRQKVVEALTKIAPELRITNQAN